MAGAGDRVDRLDAPVDADELRAAIAAVFAHARHPLAETDPEMGANLMVFAVRDWDELAELLGDLPLALEEAAAYLEETGEGLNKYLGLVRGRARELFGLDQPPADERDQRRVATVWSLSLDRVHQEAPVAEAPGPGGRIQR